MSHIRVLEILTIFLKVCLQSQQYASNTLMYPKYEHETKRTLFDFNFTVFANNNKCPAAQYNVDTDML